MKSYPGHSLCFWCQRQFWKSLLTDDHVVPLGVGGSHESGNIVRACSPCNNERGQVVSIYLLCRKLSRRTDERKPQLVERLDRKMNRWRDLQAKWVEIERERLGYSPTGGMELIVTDPKNRKHWRKELAQARQEAEKRTAEIAAFGEGIR